MKISYSITGGGRVSIGQMKSRRGRGKCACMDMGDWYDYTSGRRNLYMCRVRGLALAGVE